MIIVPIFAVVSWLMKLLGLVMRMEWKIIVFFANPLKEIRWWGQEGGEFPLVAAGLVLFLYVVAWRSR